MDGEGGPKTAREHSRASTRRRRGLRYTKKELELLKREWGEARPRTICAKMGRSWSALRLKAGKMGLTAGIPQGYLSLTAAADAMGYSQSGFLAAIRRYEARKGAVVLKAHPFSSVRAKGSKGRWSIIEIDIARRVTVEDHRWEAVAAAAKTRSLPPVTLRRWLLEAGVIQQPQPGHGRAVAYAESAVIDRVVVRNRWRLRPRPEAQAS